jgi:hypothetical protein
LNTYSRDIALEIRKINQSLEIIDAHLQDMRASLEGIVKVYPPYPPESTERIEALRQFSTLAKNDRPNRPSKINSRNGTCIGRSQQICAAGDWTMVVGDPQCRIHHPAFGGAYRAKVGSIFPILITIVQRPADFSAALDQIALAQSGILMSSRQNFIADANHVITKIV